MTGLDDRAALFTVRTTDDLGESWTPRLRTTSHARSLADFSAIGSRNTVGVEATRQFQRNFLLADGMQVKDATLGHGMLVITLERPKAPKIARQIDIRSL